MRLGCPTLCAFQRVGLLFSFTSGLLIFIGHLPLNRPSDQLFWRTPLSYLSPVALPLPLSPWRLKSCGHHTLTPQAQATKTNSPNARPQMQQPWMLCLTSSPKMYNAGGVFCIATCDSPFPSSLLYQQIPSIQWLAASLWCFLHTLPLFSMGCSLFSKNTRVGVPRTK